MCGFAADSAPGKQVLAELGQGRHAAVDGDYAPSGEQPNGQLCHVLGRRKCSLGRVGHPLHDLRGISRPVEQ